MGRSPQSPKVISGGQTGVDRAALDVAIELRLHHGGWCPLGRRAEDGRIDPKYELVETESVDYAVRTERNVIDSDATLIIYEHTLSGGTGFTYRMTVKHQRHCLLVNLADKPTIDSRQFQQWLDQHQVSILNIAGPRESTLPGIHLRASRVLQRLLRSFTNISHSNSTRGSGGSSVNKRV